MNINLLDSSTLLALSIPSAILITFLLTQFRQPRRKREAMRWQLFARVLGWSLLLAGAIAITVSYLDPADKLPGNLWLMAWPFTLGLSLIAAHFKHKWLAPLAGLTTLLGLVFGLALVNHYYRYYPTLFSLIGQQQKADTLASLQASTVQYSAKSDSTKKSANSIEDRLYAQSLSTSGTLLPVTIPGNISHFKARSGWVYLPAAVSDQDRINLPVIVLMAGMPGSPVDWLNGGGLTTTLNDFAKAHHGITPLVFVVDNLGSSFNDTECVDSPRGNVETYLSADVPAYIKSHYEVANEPSKWAIGGLSMGGMCGAMIALRHTNVYHYFLDFGGEPGPEIGAPAHTIYVLFGGSQASYEAHQLPELFLQGNRHNMGGYFAVAKDDKLQLVEQMKHTYQEAKDSGIDSVLELVGGQHTFGAWNQAFKDALPWISSQLGATECTDSCY